METYKNLKKSTKIGLIVSMVFVVFAVGVGFFNLIHFLMNDLSAGFIPALKIVMTLIMSFLTLLYATVGYRKPHGNLLRWMFMVFGFVVAWSEAMPGPPVHVELQTLGTVCSVTTALIIVFLSGRLQKIKQNQMLLCVATVFLIAQIVLKMIASTMVEFMFAVFLDSCIPLFLLLALGFAYVARYEEHKAAGLADKADA